MRGELTVQAQEGLTVLEASAAAAAAHPSTHPQAETTVPLQTVTNSVLWTLLGP